MNEELVRMCAAAMKKRAAEPLHNIPSLEPVLVGSLGDAWPYLARACLSAIEAEGLVIVPRGADSAHDR